MHTIIVVGMTGQGKSNIPKGMIEGNNKACFVFDVNNEYGPIAKYKDQTPIKLSSDQSKHRSRHVDCDFTLFIEQCFTKKGSIVVFEEATGFLSGRVGKDFKRLVTNKLFSKNVYVLLFHSIIDVPQEIMRLANYLVLFKTNDEEHFVDAKYPRLLPYFNDLQNKPNGSCHKVKMI